MKIQICNLSKLFGNTIAVKDLDLIIEDGQLVCLLGPSGCGKSTTLAMLAGLTEASQGNIYFDDHDVTQVDPEERDIGMVFQNYALYPHMTVEQNIAFPLKMQRVKKHQRAEDVEQMIKLLRLEELRRRKPAQLSGGQQQRVAIARALVKKPKLLLLDEPFSNLDARLRIELRDEIRSLQQQLKITTVFVTHDQEEAMSISDRILIMDKGIAQQYDTPKNMYHKPNNIFVAGFLGSPKINLFPASYDPKSSSLLVKGKAAVVSQLYNPAELSGEITAGVRPEDLLLSNDGTGLEAEVVSMQPVGKEIFLRLSIGGELMTAVTEWDADYQHGQKVSVNVKRLLVFAAKGS